jgi:hypothetical protein
VNELEFALRNTAGHLAGDAAPRWQLNALRYTGLARVCWRLNEGPPYFRRFAFAWALHHNRQRYSRVG